MIWWQPRGVGLCSTVLVTGESPVRTPPALFPVFTPFPFGVQPSPAGTDLGGRDPATGVSCSRSYPVALPLPALGPSRTFTSWAFIFPFLRVLLSSRREAFRAAPTALPPTAEVPTSRSPSHAGFAKPEVTTPLALPSLRTCAIVLGNTVSPFLGHPGPRTVPEDSLNFGFSPDFVHTATSPRTLLMHRIIRVSSFRVSPLQFYPSILSCFN